MPQPDSAEPSPASESASESAAASAELERLQRTAAYAVIRDRQSRVLLVRASQRSDLAGYWFLPGGGLRHGESPIDAVRRELAEETGLVVPAASVHPVGASGDVVALPHRGVLLHTTRLIYEAGYGVDQPPVRPEPDGTSDEVRFVSLAEATSLPLMPYVARQLGLPEHAPQVSVPVRPEPLVDGGDGGGRPVVGTAEDDPGDGGQSAPSSGPEEGDVVDQPSGGEREPVVRVQRTAAYAVLVSGDPRGEGRILLSKLTGGDLWTLPGGGIDHGEEPLEALTREVYEEAGLPYTTGPLLDITSRHFTGRAPSGRLEDFQGIRLLYGGSVPDEPEPRVLDIGGSSDDAAWFSLHHLPRIQTVTTVRHGLRMLRRSLSG